MYKLEIKPSEKIHTIFGTAKIENGYYRIVSRKEKNYQKFFHRLIFEDFYGEIPNECVIHHKDMNSLNNCIFNLQILTKSKHTKLHSQGNTYFLGREHSQETKNKISHSKKGVKLSKETKDNLCKIKNSSGYYRVHKEKDKGCTQGFMWRYKCYDDNGKLISIRKVNLDDLKEEVLKRGLKWEKI